MKEKIIKLTHTTSLLCIIGASISSPLFFLPLTSEFYEFNKFSLLLTLTIISTISWAVRMVLQKRFSYTKTPLDIPLIILAGAVLIASFSSIDQYISIFGSGGNKWLTLSSFLTLVVFYFTSISSLRSKKETSIILTVLVISTTIAALVSIFAYFGVFAPFDFAQFRSFNTLGSPNRLAILESIVLPLTIAWILFTNSRRTRTLSVLSSAILVISLILIDFRITYVGLAIGIIVITAATLKTKITREAIAAISLVGLITLSIASIKLIPPLANAVLENAISAPQGTANKADLPKVLTLSQQIGWNIAASTIANPRRALFGTGPNTFQFVYTQLKPRTVNNTNSWPVRFDKSSSEFTEIIATAGIVGAIAFLFFVVTSVRFAWNLIFKSAAGSAFYVPVAASIIGGLILGFLTTFSISIISAIFIIIICLITIAKTQDEKYVQEMSIEVATLRNSFNWLPAGDKFASLRTTPSDNAPAKSQTLPMIFLIVSILASLFAARTEINAWRAENLYRQSLIAANRNDGGKTIELVQQAIRTNPHVDTYHRVLSQTALAAAINLNQKKDLSQDERNLLAQLAQAAIEQAKIASGYQILPLRVPGISAANVANWETLSNAYQAVMASIQGAEVNALNTLAQALNLDPQNPILHDQLGLLQLRLKNADAAQRKFEDSIVTKGDYGPAYYHLAKLLIENDPNNVAKIAEALNGAKRLLPKEDPAIGDIDKNLETFNKKLEELRTQSANQTAETTPSPSPSPSPTPKSGTKVAPKPTTSPFPSPEPTPTPSL